MITLYAATQGAEVFFHVFMKVSLSLSLLISFAFGKMFLNKYIK